MPGVSIPTSGTQQWPQLRKPAQQEARIAERQPNRERLEALRPDLLAALLKSFPLSDAKNPGRSFSETEIAKHRDIIQVIVSKLLARIEPPHIDLRIPADDPLVNAVKHMPPVIWMMLKDAGVSSVTLGEHVRFTGAILSGLKALQVNALTVEGTLKPELESRLNSELGTTLNQVVTVRAPDDFPGPPPGEPPQAQADSEGAARGSRKAEFNRRRAAQGALRKARQNLANIAEKGRGDVAKAAVRFVAVATEMVPSEFDTAFKTEMDLAVMRGRGDLVRALVRAILADEEFPRQRKLDLLMGRMPARTQAQPQSPPTTQVERVKRFVPQLSAFVEEETQSPVQPSLLARMCANGRMLEGAQYDALDDYVGEILNANLFDHERAAISAAMREAQPDPVAKAVFVMAILESQMQPHDKDRLLQATGLDAQAAAEAMRQPALNRVPWAVRMRMRIEAGEAARKLMDSPGRMLKLQHTGDAVTIEGMWDRGSFQVLCRSDMPIPLLSFSMAPPRPNYPARMGDGFYYLVNTKDLEPAEPSA